MIGRSGNSERARSRPKGTALQYAVKLLAVKPYSEMKLREKLAGRQFTDDEIATAVTRLISERLLDDRHFAEEFVRARLAARPRAGIMLVRDLYQRGIPRKLAQDVVNELAPKQNDLEVARELVKRKSALFKNLDDQTRRRRLTGFLARRGFSYETIAKALPDSRSAETDSD